MKLLLYCTKAKPYLADFKGDYQIYSNGKELDDLFDKGFNPNDIMDIFNGKIVAECDFEIEQITPFFHWCDELEKKTGLSREAVLDYLDTKDKSVGNPKRQKSVNLINIKNLYIFDESRKLYDCLIRPKIESKYYGCEHLGKAPKNMMYVELDDIKYILISIGSDKLCKILNGNKTIEVRKKVLKEML